MNNELTYLKFQHISETNMERGDPPLGNLEVDCLFTITLEYALLYNTFIHLLKELPKLKINFSTGHAIAL